MRLWRWLRQWVRRLAVFRVRPKKRPGVMSAAEVAEKAWLTPAEREAVVEKLPDLGAPKPEDLEPGAVYLPKYGTTVYRDSESIVPFIGSEQEAIEAAKPKMPWLAKPTPPGKKTCRCCFGWGWFGERRCEACGGKGWT